MVDLTTTNWLLAVMAVERRADSSARDRARVAGVSPLPADDDRAWRSSKRGTSRRCASRSTRFSADVQAITARVSHQTERVDHAISGTIDRVDDTAERVQHSVREQVVGARRVVRGVRAVIMSLLTTEPPVAGRRTRRRERVRITRRDHMAYEYDRIEREDGGGSFLMGLLAGTVLGAGLGMLFAPKAGLGDAEAADRSRRTVCGRTANETYAQATRRSPDQPGVREGQPDRRQGREVVDRGRELERQHTAQRAPPADRVPRRIDRATRTTRRRLSDGVHRDRRTARHDRECGHGGRGPWRRGTSSCASRRCAGWRGHWSRRYGARHRAARGSRQRSAARRGTRPRDAIRGRARRRRAMIVRVNQPADAQRPARAPGAGARARRNPAHRSGHLARASSASTTATT